MIEWFTNIFNWFVENKDAIIVTLTSANFASIIAVVIAIIKQVKAVKSNTTLSNEVVEISSKLHDTLKSNIELTNTAARLEKENLALKTECDIIKHNADEVLSKVNAMLDVQSLVYSTVKDDTIRSAVSNILINAKYTVPSHEENLNNVKETIDAVNISEIENSKENSVYEENEVNEVNQRF